MKKLIFVIILLAILGCNSNNDNSNNSPNNSFNNNVIRDGDAIRLELVHYKVPCDNNEGFTKASCLYIYKVDMSDVNMVEPNDMPMGGWFYIKESVEPNKIDPNGE